MEKGKTSCAVTVLFWLILAIEIDGSDSHIYKTIKADDGDVYECVDVHRQPSLQHPALKSHKVQMRPSILGRQLLKRQQVASDRGSKAMIGLKESCPLGSVPILKSAPRKLRSQNLTKPLEGSTKAILFAGVTTKGGQQITASAACYTINNPKLVTPDQRSSAILALESRNGGSFSRVEAGWTVNPKLYGDDRTRLYTAWTTDESRSTGCFDDKCPGFIHTSRFKPNGYAFPNVGLDYTVCIQIYKDTQGIFLDVDGDQIGYWPFDIVPNMKSGPLEAKWGGEAFIPDTHVAYPQMGDGNYDTKRKFDLTASVQVISMGRENGDDVIPSDATVQLSTCPCYFVGLNEFRNDEHQYSFIYGGTGGVLGRDCP